MRRVLRCGSRCRITMAGGSDIGVLQRSGIMVALALLPVAAGCGGPGYSIKKEVIRGEYGHARAEVASRMEGMRDRKAGDDRPGDMYDLMNMVMMSLADGLPDLAAPTADEAFEILRTQGINQDRTVKTMVLWEGANFWKGEPFEQAMTFVYIAIQKAMSGEWDNARAASLNALFLLKDFGMDGDADTEELARAALEAERKRRQENPNYDHLDQGYRVVKSDFCLGYLVAGVVNAALGKSDPDRVVESHEHFNDALAVNPISRAVVERLFEGRYNTVLMIEYGLGPTKESYGMDNVFTRFRQKEGWPSSNEPLRVVVNGVDAGSFPPVCDMNVMAANLHWRDMHQVRVAKSVLGTAMLAGGAAMMTSDNRNVQAAGLAVAAMGAVMKATARADTTHCEVLPQRVYVAPLWIAEASSTIELQVAGDSGSRLVLVGVHPPGRLEPMQLRYVRLAPWRGTAQHWAISGRVMYANDAYNGRVPGDTLPYILGGRCVCKPSEDALLRYQQAGFLRDMTAADLENLYRDERILLEPEEIDQSLEREEDETAVLHVLEGGRSLECPLPGTAGFARLFCQEHPPYRPRSERVRQLADAIAAGRAAE